MLQDQFWHWGQSREQNSIYLHGEYILAGLTVHEQRANKNIIGFKVRNLVKQTTGEGDGFLH